MSRRAPLPGASARAIAALVYHVPHTKRMIGPKLTAVIAPAKNSPGTDDS